MNTIENPPISGLTVKILIDGPPACGKTHFQRRIMAFVESIKDEYPGVCAVAQTEHETIDELGNMSYIEPKRRGDPFGSSVQEAIDGCNRFSKTLERISKRIKEEGG